MRFMAICRKFLIKIAKVQKIYQNSQKNMRERVDCNDYQNRKLLIPDSGKIGSNSTQSALLSVFLAIVQQLRLFSSL